jgi:hypothetical protein
MRGTYDLFLIDTNIITENYYISNRGECEAARKVNRYKNYAVVLMEKMGCGEFSNNSQHLAVY